MFRLLGLAKRDETEIVNSNNESDYSSEEDADTPFDTFNKPIAIQKWGDDVVVSYHFLSIRDVAQYLSSWCFNRKLEEAHKDAIKAELFKNDNPHLMGTVQLVRDKKLNCRILNGQHRIKAIQEIIKEDIDMKFQMNVMFEVYDVNIEDIDDLGSSHQLVETMFKIANNSLNIKPEQDHDLLCKKIVVAMMNDNVLKKGIVDKTNGTVHKPRILAKHLFESFKSFLQPNITLSVPEILIRIKQINVDISTMPFVKLFGRQTPAQQKIKQFEKAKEIGFFLNLNGKMSPDVWMDMI